MSEALSFLQAVSGFTRAESRSSADRPIRLGTVDPAYDPWDTYPDAPPPARVTFDGESTLSGKAYGYVGGFVPWPGTRVYLLPIGNTYVIGGMINSQTPQGFWSNAAGTESGVELGGGTYYDTTEGLVVAGDVSVAGDLEVSGVGAELFRQMSADGPSVVNTATVWSTATNLYLDLPVGTWEIHAHLAYTTVGGDIQTRWAFNGAWTGGKFVQGPSPFQAGTATVVDTHSYQASVLRSGWHQLTTGISYAGNDSGVFASAHEWGVVTVTTAGRWSIEYTQRVANAAQALMRQPSYLTGKRRA